MDKVRKEEALLLVIDIQDSLAKAVHRSEDLKKSARILLEAADAFGLPVLVTTQYKKGLGDLSESLLPYTKEADFYDKTLFSIYEDEKIKKAVDDSGKKDLIVVGMESHICVMSSVLDLLEAGYRVFVPEDGIGSRTEKNHKNALGQMGKNGAVITNVESLLFQMLGGSSAPEFKRVQGLIK